MTREEAIEVLHELDGQLYETQIVALKMAIKALEQEPILDKIRAEIEQARYGLVNDGLDIALNIIDKYKAETEAEDGNNNH